jgi:hypothetical protein
MAALASGAADAPTPTAKRAGDAAIREALLQEHKANPERKVCIQRVFTGSRQPRAVCGTLKEFFEQRRPDEVSAGDPPYELIEQVKENRRKVEAKARAAAN